MKLTVLLLVIACFQVNASTYAQRITLRYSNEPFRNVIEKISRQSGYSVLADAKDMQDAQNVTIDVKNVSLEDALQASFAGQSFTYEIVKRTILIKDKNPAWVISGTVLSNGGGPVPGASVTIKGTTRGTTTNADGTFSINIATPNAVLVISSIGYAVQEVSVSQSQPAITVMLVAQESVMENIVIATALGIKRTERSLTYSAQQVSSDDVTKVKDANFVNSLNGKVAGVTINSSSSGAGGATKVVMRGTKSIAKGNNALYVIDGVPMYNNGGSFGTGRFGSTGGSEGIADLNPDDIESITVLTGASAAALYGSEAANGALLITTKKGKAGKLSVSFSSQADFMKPFVLPRFQNKYGNKPGDIKSWGDSLSTPSDYDPADFFESGSSLMNGVSLSTGTDKNQTLFSASSANASGIVPNNRYNRYNFTFRNTAKFLNDKMLLDVGANYILQSDRNMRNQGEYFSSIVPVYLFPRGEDFSAIRAYERFDEGSLVSYPYWPYGEGGYSMQNPYWVANRIVNTTTKDRYILTGSLKYDLLSWLSAAARIRYDNATVGAEEKRNAGTLLQFTGNSPKGFYAHLTGFEKQTYGDFILSANKSIDDYSLSVNAGGIYSDKHNRVRDGFRAPLKEDGISNFFSPYNQRLSGQDAGPVVSYSGTRTYSLFFSGDLGWRKMLYLTITGRNDWASSLVNTKNRSFFYPSAGLSAIVSEMTTLPQAISFLKVRGSFARVGNPPTSGLTSPTYTYDVQTSTWAPPGYVPVQELFPEQTDSWEAGINARFLNNKLSFDATYYHTNTFKQTFNPAISTTSGYSSIYIQTGNIENKGVEAILGYADKYGGGFGWDTKLTFSANRNKIIELVNQYRDPVTGESYSINELRLAAVSDAQFILRKGGTLGDVFSTTDIRRDENGQVFVNPVDGNIYPQTNVENYLGSVFPKYNVGWNNEFSYKGVNFGFLLTARVGGIVISSTQAVLDNFGVSASSADWRDKGGIPVNSGLVSAQKWFDVVGASQGMTAYYTYSATNSRLQEMHLSYELPASWLKNIPRITIGVTGRNLLMIYNKAPFDPETTASTGNFYQGLDYFMMPSLKSMGVSLKLQF